MKGQGRRPRVRTAWMVGGTAVGLLVALVGSLCLGSVPAGIPAVFQALTGHGDPTLRTIIADLRFPRAVGAILVGAALSTSGATFQALLRNPLADPFVLGISGGAALGAVGAIVLAQIAGVAWPVEIGAIVGALVTIVVVVRVAAGVGSTLDTRVLLLSGVIVGAFANAGIWLLLTVADVNAFRSATEWMMGSLSGVTWGTVRALSLVFFPGIVVLFAIARPLNALAMGEETAAYLGVPVERVKWIAYAVASLLAAAAVAAGGIIGFVGLIVPHAIRLAGGSNHRILIPASGLLGAIFLLVTDTAARTVAAPTELPLGAITALIGVPFFISLLRRMPRGQTA